MRKFAKLYDGDGVATAKAAGYSGGVRSLAAQAARLLKHPDVQLMIRERGGPTAPSRAVSQDRVNVERKYRTLEERQAWWAMVMDDDAVPWPARVKAAEKLGQMHGDFLERVEVSGQISLAALIASDGAKEVTPLPPTPLAQGGAPAPLLEAELLDEVDE